MTYINPLLSELYSELYFEETISPQVQFDIVCALRNESDTLEVTPIQEPKVGLSQRYRIYNCEKTLLIQVFRNRILYNYVPEQNSYKGWEYFLSKAIKLKEKLLKLFPDINFSRYGLCYSNKITNLQSQDFRLGNYINCSGELIPKYIGNEHIATDIIIGNGNIEFEENYQLKLKLDTQEYDNFLIIFEISSRIPCKDVSINDTLTQLHTRCLELFEKLLTDYTKNNIMGGMNE